ncbi:MAG: response regulator [Candidatus Auribacterota bacterium]|nr:response regulator [Candidatus Auribacterota bacterium]
MRDFNKTKSELIKELEVSRRRIEELEASVTNLLSEQSRVHGGGGGKTVMIVDDESVFRESTGQMLESAGYHVLLAPGGEEALELLVMEKGQVDIVVLDMVMKGMGGTETFQKMRRLKADLPIIICTGNAFAAEQALSGSTQEMLARAGITFMQKPFRPEQLISEVHSKIG